MSSALDISLLHVRLPAGKGKNPEYSQNENQGNYQCRVHNSSGDLGSTAAVLTVDGNSGGTTIVETISLPQTWPSGYVPPESSGNFFVGGTGLAGYYADPTVGAPVSLGSAALAKLTPRGGGKLTINEYGLNVAEREWSCPSAAALSLKLNIRNNDPYVAGLNCVTSEVVDGEGKQSVVRATYKGLVNGVVRPSERIVRTDTDVQTQTVKAGTTVGGGTGAGGSVGAITDNYRTITDIPVPSPVVTFRGASKTEPSMTPLG